MPASPLLDCFGLPSRLLAMLTTAKIANVMYLVIQFIKHLKAVLLARFSKPRRYLTQYAQVALWNEWPSQLPLNHKRNHKRTQSLSYTATLQWPKYAKITKIHFLKDLKFLKVDFSRNGLFRTCSGLYSPGFSGSSGGPLGSWKVTIPGDPGGTKWRAVENAIRHACWRGSHSTWRNPENAGQNAGHIRALNTDLELPSASEKYWTNMSKTADQIPLSHYTSLLSILLVGFWMSQSGGVSVRLPALPSRSHRSWP
jgi:hypothetical protein